MKIIKKALIKKSYNRQTSINYFYRVINTKYLLDFSIVTNDSNLGHS